MTRDLTRSPARILIVDDDPDDVELTIKSWEESKLLTDFKVVGNGMEALDLLRAQAKVSRAGLPHLILLDLNMPRIDGREVLNAIKSDPALKHIPVVVLTTSKDDLDVLRSYAAGANCFITKPVDLTQMASVVKSIDTFWLTVVTLPES